MSIYPSIDKACHLIALDNGGINRNRSEKQRSSEFDAWLATSGYSVEELRYFDEWLRSCDDEILYEICCDGAIATEDTPPRLNDFLNDYFDRVC